jgi:hypothetical protein
MLVLFSVAGVAALFGLFHFVDSQHTRYGAGRLQWCGLHDGEWVVLSSMYHSGGDGDVFHTGRVAWLDRRTGKPLRRVLLPREVSAQHRRGGLLIVREEGVTGVLDLATGVVRSGAEAFGTVAPALARDGVSSATFKPDQDVFEVTSGKGERVEVALRALGAGEAERAVMRRFSLDRDPEHEFSHLRVDGRAVSDLRLLSPKILWEGADACLLWQLSSLRRGAPIELTLVEGRGQVRWTTRQDRLRMRPREDEHIESRQACAVDDLIIVPLEGERDLIVALDLRDGAPRWFARV